MSFEARCPQCVFLTAQVGRRTPCLLHVALVEADEAAVRVSDTTYDEPYTFGQLRLTVDRPGPFSLREYVRLQLLRSRIQANPSRLDQSAPPTHARSLSRR